MNIDDLHESSLVSSWLKELEKGSGRFAELLRIARQGSGEGFFHTLREICQQPVAWSQTARHLVPMPDLIADMVASCQRILLTGSGSSQYAGECAAPVLEERLERTVEAIGGGDLLMRGKASVAGEPTLVISPARSGESPESVAVVDLLLRAEPRTHHLVITCNSEGRLAREFAGDDRVRVIDVGPQVNDSSLVMTSSFTNLVLSAWFLGWLEQTERFVRVVDCLDHAGREVLTRWPDELGAWIAGGTDRVVFLGSGSRFGSWQEGSLKLLDMTAGKVGTMAQAYLGLRHGPICYINWRTLIVCFLSSDELIRSDERDLMLELNAKGLGIGKLFAGLGDPGAALRQQCDVTISYDLPADIPDASLTILDVMIAQILGFHRCLKERLQPDQPSASGVIRRVVGKFPIHHAARATK
jgi:tagatose-6-phosphate ketose/aldose isomerase